MEIEFSNQNNTIKSLEGLIKFYKQEKGADNIFQEYEEKIKNLEEIILIKEKKLEEVTKDLNEQLIINEKLINALAEKTEKEKNNEDDSDDSNENE